MGISGEAQICLNLETFYGIVSYAVGVSLILSLVGVKVGRSFFRRRRSASPSSQQQKENEELPSELPALEEDRVTVATERQTPPPSSLTRGQGEEPFQDMSRVTRGQGEEPFQDIMSRVLHGGQNRAWLNPFNPFNQCY